MELFVCIAIFSLLVGLLIPAVSSIRERARRVQCQSQLRQLGLAIHAFHDTHRRTPPGPLFGTYGTGPDSTAWSWIARLLPFLEQQEIYDQGRIPQVSLSDSGIANHVFPFLLCPSDSELERSPRLDAGNMLGLAFAVGPTSYKAVCGANWGADHSQGFAVGQLATHWIRRGTNGSWDGQSEGDGIMFRTDHRIRRRFSDVSDGLTHTVMLGEVLPDRDAYTSWPYANNSYATCAIPLNHPGTEDPLDWPNNLSFRSRHDGGANFCYADGRVRFLADSIALSVYRQLATIQGAEISESVARYSTSGHAELGRRSSR